MVSFSLSLSLSLYSFLLRGFLDWADLRTIHPIGDGMGGGL